MKKISKIGMLISLGLIMMPLVYALTLREIFDDVWTALAGERQFLVWLKTSFVLFAGAILVPFIMAGLIIGSMRYSMRNRRSLFCAKKELTN